MTHSLDTPATPEGDAISRATHGLRRIVEEIDGAMNHGTWRDDHGVRLKDTPEWVALYNAMRPSAAALTAQPVAWRYRDARDDKSKWTVQKNRPDWWKGGGPSGYVLEPLYAHPATPAPVEAGLRESLLKWCDDRQFDVVNCLDLRADEEASAVLWIENFRAALRAQSAPVGGEVKG